MSDFPKIPTVVGDTDDDASIHLHSRVGPAKPLALDREILKILNEDEDIDDNMEFNKNFEYFKKNGTLQDRIEKDRSDSYQNRNYNYTERDNSKGFESNRPNEGIASEPENINTHLDDESDKDPDYQDHIFIGTKEAEGEEEDEEEDDELTEVESVISDSKSHPPKQNNPGSDVPPKKIHFNKYEDLMTIVFVIVLFLFGIVLSRYFKGTKDTVKPVENYYEINSRFNQLDQEIEKLNKFNLDSSQKQEELEQSYISLSNTFNSRFEVISNKFNDINFDLLRNDKFNQLENEIQDMKSNINSIDLVTNTKSFESRLNDLSGKLNALSNINEQIETSKTIIIDDLINTLPEKLPIYIKDDKVHYAPEFNKFLYTFIDSYFKENISWNQFIQDNKSYLNEFIQSIIEKSSSNPMQKSTFENILNKKFKDNNKVIFEKFNNLIDNLNVDSSSNFSLPNTSSNKILLSNLLEIFAKGSISVNYADYKLGSRILGFLTSLPKETKSLNRKLFLGWYDYLVSSTPSFKDLKYNANNVLIDGGQSWSCDSLTCTLGVRLSNSVILTDLIFQSPKISEFNNPDFVSIYIKPKTKTQHTNLVNYLNDFKFNFKRLLSNNQYIKKFIKVKEVSMNPDKSINHIKMPLSLVNLRIPVKDVYIEMSSSRGITGLYNLKAFGITEFNSYKYDKELDLLVDNLKDVTDVNSLNIEDENSYQGDYESNYDIMIGEEPELV